VMAHPAFTARFADDLVQPGLRVPITADAKLFAEAVALGNEVIWLHCYGERFTDSAANRPKQTPRLPKESAQFPGDEISSTWHLAVFDSLANDALPISCASFMLNSYQEAPAWQLRGMCTDGRHQSKGFGGRLLDCAEAVIVGDSKVRLFWCNARVPAIPFYERHGWIADSDVFDIPTAGPHRKMLKKA